MERLQEIRARLTVLEENYAVHVPCGSEAEPPSEKSGRYTCCKCGPVSRDEVLAPCEREEFIASDIRYLLDIVEQRQRLHTKIDQALDEHLKGTL